MVKQYAGDKIIKVATTLLAIVFGLVVFHAPLSVFFGQFLPPLLIKSWKEILLIASLPLVVFVVILTGSLAYFSRDILLRLVVFFALLHIGLLFAFETNVSQKLAGLAIDLRYMLFFALVYCLVLLRPVIRKTFIKIGAWAGGASVGFAALQALVLPPDILKYIGYSKETISPYLTVDKNSSFIRINGTLRGPNPLGAYVMIILSLMAAGIAYSREVLLKYKYYFAAIGAALIVVLWASYSRSAWLGVVISIGIIVAAIFGRRLRLKNWLTISALALLILGALFITRDSYFTQNVILHNNPSESQSFNSNEAHALSLQGGADRFIDQPFGAGVGSTGSASLFGDEPLIIENQYLFVAHETGWLGLGLFVAILGIVLNRLYKNRHDWLNLGVFASGVALVGIGLIQPVFADDTVSLVWWGLAAIALASTRQGKVRHEEKPH